MAEMFVSYLHLHREGKVWPDVERGSVGSTAIGQISGKLEWILQS